MALKLKTSRFGEVEYNSGDIINFEDGLLGFKDKKKFLLMDHPAKDTEQKEKQTQIGIEFIWLQSVDDPELAFVLIDPSLFRDDYKVSLTPEEENHSILAIVTVPQDPIQITANLRGPLVINKEKGTGKQLVLENKAYSTRHYIIAEMQYKELEKLKAKQAAMSKAVSE